MNAGETGGERRGSHEERGEKRQRDRETKRERERERETRSCVQIVSFIHSMEKIVLLRCTFHFQQSFLQSPGIDKELHESKDITPSKQCYQCAHVHVCACVTQHSICMHVLSLIHRQTQCVRGNHTKQKRREGRGGWGKQNLICVSSLCPPAPTPPSWVSSVYVYDLDASV